MKFKGSKCDNCDRPATVYLTEILGGEKIEKHLCEHCAAAEGVTIKADIPISQLLEDFVLQTSDQQEGDELKCEVCGLTFKDFRQKGLLGCPNDYQVFGSALTSLMERSQEGAGQHMGKVPHRAGSDQKKQTTILRLRAELQAAIVNEDYEQAAILRDQIKEFERT